MLERYPERLEDIGTATPRCVGSVAMLGDAHSRARGNEGSDRRDVERRDRAAAGPGGVDQLHRTVGAERHHRATECSRYAGQFGGRLASGAQPEEQPADLRRCGLAGHHGRERVRDAALAQRPTLGDRPQRCRRARLTSAPEDDRCATWSPRTGAGGAAPHATCMCSMSRSARRACETTKEMTRAEQPDALDVLFDEDSSLRAIREVHDTNELVVIDQREADERAGREVLILKERVTLRFRHILDQ